MSFVERDVPYHRNLLAERIEHDFEGLLCPDQDRGVRNLKRQSHQQFGSAACLRSALLG